MIICTKCKIEKDESRFEYRKVRKCFRTVCKDCRNARSRSQYLEKAEETAQYRKKMRAINKDEVNRKSRERYWKNRDILLPQKRTHKKDSNESNERCKKWRAKPENKIKISAHQKVYWAVKKGKMIKPERCQMCGGKTILHGHHHDYSLPLDVIWVCDPCHKKIHSIHFNSGS